MARNGARVGSTRVVGALVLAGALALAASCGSTDTVEDPGDASAPADAAAAPDAPATDDPDAAHAALFVGERFPSAQECRVCHAEHYRQWSVSPHAYAQLSPVFNAMQGMTQRLTHGTNGDFCIRCHTPVGMALDEPIFTANAERHATSREGITCIVCHRVDRPVGKVSGRRPLVTGPLTLGVFGPTGDEELQRVIASPDYHVVTDDTKQGRQIHGKIERFFALTEPGFCGACHDVTLPNGFRLEEAFSEHKLSPAAGRGESCQDCHMGLEPGVANGYPEGHAAVVGGKPTRTRRITNHMFVGPDYSVVHPGFFPHNPEAAALASIDEWTQFDWKAGWGTDAFEDEVGDDAAFPPRWASIDDRYDAREIIDGQVALLAEATEQRLALLRRGYVLGEVSVEQASAEDGLRFDVEVKNGTDGHNVPTGFTAERLVFLRVTVTDDAGETVFVSGDLDPNGDVRDAHSLYVHAGELPRDEQLFSLQSKFVTRANRGGERERILAVNRSIDALPFVRPETSASILTGRPGNARIHKKGIEPGGARTASYSVGAEKLRAGARHRIRVQLIAAMVPVNLVGAIQEVGFDYGMSARAVADAIVDGHLVLWEKELDVDVK